MTAKEKFEARLQELGLMEEWTKQGECGKVGKVMEKNDDKIVILIHENDEDNYSEQWFPPYRNLRANENFRRECKNDFYCHEDDHFVAKLANWLEFGEKSTDCPLFPVDVYFPANGLELSVKDFVDDEEEEYQDFVDDEEEEYQDFLTQNREEIESMMGCIRSYKHRLESMIRTEFRRGHNLCGQFDPYPGWDSHTLCGYEIENKTMVIEEMRDGYMALALYQDGYDTIRLHLSASDFPIAVLFTIYAAMK